MTKGHFAESGLQHHSIGVLYPWTVRGVGNSLQSFHCITGEQGQKHQYGSEQTFEQAHLKAEIDCVSRVVPVLVVTHYTAQNEENQMPQSLTIKFAPFTTRREYESALATIEGDLITANSNGKLTIEGGSDRVDAALEDMLRSFEIIEVQRQAA